MKISDTNDKRKDYDNLIGQSFGLLTVIEKADDTYVQQAERLRRHINWKCKCQCGNECIVWGQNLKRGHVKSCGCLKKSCQHTKYNSYIIDGDVTIGYTANNEPFYFDTEDYDLIKDYYWSLDKSGYVINCKNKLRMHRLVLNCPKKLNVDHINHNKNDNRKHNLRICTQSQNNMNKSLQINNTSGVTGIVWLKDESKWRAMIKVNGNTITIGDYKSKQDAIMARKKAEEKYFKDFSLDNSLKISQPINDNIINDYQYSLIVGNDCIGKFKDVGSALLKIQDYMGIHYGQCNLSITINRVIE